MRPNIELNNDNGTWYGSWADLKIEIAKDVIMKQYEWQINMDNEVLSYFPRTVLTR